MPSSSAKGRAANKRGKAHEERALRLVRSLGREARMATADEDAQGCDIVVASDDGDLWLQVKSSRHGADRHRERYGPWRIQVVVVHEHRSDWQVEADIKVALCVLRMMRGLEAA